MLKLEWHNEKRKISDLIPYESNPRQITEKQYSDLKKSVTKFNLAEIPAINLDNKICAGHQRLKAMSEVYGNDFEIDVRVPNRKLSEKEFKEYNVRSNKNTAGWEYDILANEFEIEELIEWGFEEKELDLDKLKDGEEVVLDNAIQLLPKREYVIIMCNENNDEWEDIRTKLKLGNVKRGGYKNGSIMQSIGIQRVVKAGEFLELWK